jgi:hypothetical protein
MVVVFDVGASKSASTKYVCHQQHPRAYSTAYTEAPWTMALASSQKMFYRQNNAFTTIPKDTAPRDQEDRGCAANQPRLEEDKHPIQAAPLHFFYSAGASI